MDYFIDALERLGIFLYQFSDEDICTQDEVQDLNIKHLDNFRNIIEKTVYKNAWFTPEFIRLGFKSWGELLHRDKIGKWLSGYSPSIPAEIPKKVGLIMAGNIPLVGFHDLLCVLASGHRPVIKLSSKDDVIIPAILGVLNDIEPVLAQKVEITEDRLKGIDAVIATGSDNSSRYFEYYFGKYPNIIRKNRNSVAVLTGSETDSELRKLADDVFLYFGLGCRNVSKLYLPEGFNPTRLLDNFEKYHYFLNHNKYANNHDYQKAILMVNLFKFFDNDFLILREDNSISSPVACLNYQFYNKQDELVKELKENSEKIQCIVSGAGFLKNTVDFGRSQFPDLNDYADNTDTIKFLSNL